MAAEDTLAAPVPSPLQVIADNLNKLSQRQKIAGAIALAVAIALLVGVWLWSNKPQYSILFSNIAEKDGGAIITALQQQNVPYRVENGGSTITVPENRANELRLMLASQGLPKGGLVGFELLETQKIGVSQFNEQINYQRGLEGELARTIQSLSAVSGARVHLAIPKQSAFLRDEQKPTASVVVALVPGRKLEPQQLAGIVHLVSASVPELSSDQVSIIDQNGNLLTRARDPRSMGLDSTQLGYVEEVENSYSKRIETILAPVLGQGNFRAQVTADVDFDSTEQTSETYKPNPSPNTAIRSQQSNENITNQPPPAGVPGALSNQPPVPATAPITSPPVLGQGTAAQSAPLTSNKSSTINYEVDKTVQHIKRSLGSVKRLSVAVVVNNRSEKDPKGAVKMVSRSEDEMGKIDALVREAVGFNKERGDTLNLANTPFTEVAREDVAELPIWKDPSNLALAKEALRWLLLLAVVFFIWRAVIQPLMVTVMPPPAEAGEKGEDGEPMMSADGTPMAAEGATEEDQDIPPEVLQAELAKMSFEKKVARAKEIAAKEPKMVAQMLKEWMGSTPSGEGR
ncbi:flagellar basal-body MS-ring/collar protein FliF [Uliginosibacterium sp. H3]|uniref:Flagellar M-ring protein n=1 Tax=Uliginosibacterium silvisoli TaxID=3114758 RepID=A0ABU6K6S1_9RHOO|nr:flagellar basal-body MS-ring/collar protein FliF [Uliginosibacterium sp. H3]